MNLSYKQLFFPVIGSVLLLNACSSVIGSKNNTPQTSRTDQTPTRHLTPGVIGTEGQTAQAEDIATLLLNTHNQWRQQAGVPALVWSEGLAQHAQNWAEQLKTKYCILRAQPDNPYAENLFSGIAIKPQQVVNYWGRQHSNYDAKTGQCLHGRGCAHYSQMIAPNTQEMGCGIASCDNLSVWVCHYNPP